MSMKYLTVTAGAPLVIALSGALFAQTAVDQSAAGTAEQYKHMKVDEATAADSKYHANRTEANRQARDRAESEAGVAIDRANGVDRGGQR